MVPTSSVTSTARGRLASSLFPLDEYFLKPCASTLTVYIPEGRFVTEKVPLSDVAVVRSTPVASLRTASFALGTADPEGSLIVPGIVDRSDWPKTTRVSSRHAASFTQTERINVPFQISKSQSYVVLCSLAERENQRKGEVDR